MSHAIDREAIVEGLMFGSAPAATQWVAAGTTCFVDDLGDSTTYDVDRAKELMAEAGLEDGFTFNAMCPCSRCTCAWPRSCRASSPRSASR